MCVAILRRASPGLSSFIILVFCVMWDIGVIRAGVRQWDRHLFCSSVPCPTPACHACCGSEMVEGDRQWLEGMVETCSSEQAVCTHTFPACVHAVQPSPTTLLSVTGNNSTFPCPPFCVSLFYRTHCTPACARALTWAGEGAGLDLLVGSSVFHLWGICVFISLAFTPIHVSQTTFNSNHSTHHVSVIKMLAVQHASK